VFLFGIENELKQVEEREYEYPHEIDKVPVQTNFFYHLVMTHALHIAFDRENENADVDDHPGEYVETVKAGDEEKEIGKCRLTVFVILQIPVQIIPSRRM